MKRIITLVLSTLLATTAMNTYAQLGRGGPPPEPGRASDLVDLTGSGRGGPPPEPGRASAPVDLTGTWVSIVTEDWRWRMVTPQIGDLANIPENKLSREYAMEWRPEMDVGNECRAYGAPAIMHRPGRINISWEDDKTLKLDFDAGHQTRNFYFDPSVEAGEPSRQGHSVAQWESPRGMQVSPEISNVVPIGMQFPRPEMVSNALQVTTNNITAGYLRKNGLQHSDQVEMREYFNLITIPDGSTWLVIDIIVEDPTYLTTPWVTSMNFKKEADDSNWSPEDCFVTNPGW